MLRPLTKAKRNYRVGVNQIEILPYGTGLKRVGFFLREEAHLCRGGQSLVYQHITHIGMLHFAHPGMRKQLRNNYLSSTTLSRPEKSLPQNGNFYAT